MIRPILFAFLMLTVLAAPAAFAKGVEVGKTIPSITAKDQAGKEQSFDSLKGSKGLTIVFVRSLEWCTFCQRQVMDLQENAAKFKDAGYPLVTVSYDTPEKLAQFSSKFKVNLPMLSDPRSDVIKAFGIFNDNYAKGTMAFGTPFPGVYVVNADKTVKAKFFKEGVQDRPAVSELLASMKEPVAMDPAEEFPQEPAPAPVIPDIEAAAPVAEPSSLPSADPSLSLEHAPVEPVAPTIPPAPEPSMAEPSIDLPAPAVDVPSAGVDPVIAPSDEPPPMEFMPPSEEVYDDEGETSEGTPSGL